MFYLVRGRKEMVNRPEDAYYRLVDQVIAEALGLLPDGLQKEVFIRSFGLRDGGYQTEQEVAEALGISPREVHNLGRQALQTILEARREGQLRIGASG